MHWLAVLFSKLVHHSNSKSEQSKHTSALLNPLLVMHNFRVVAYWSTIPWRTSSTRSLLWAIFKNIMINDLLAFFNIEHSLTSLNSIKCWQLVVSMIPTRDPFNADMLLEVKDPILHSWYNKSSSIAVCFIDCDLPQKKICAVMLHKLWKKCSKSVQSGSADKMFRSCTDLLHFIWKKVQHVSALLMLVICIDLLHWLAVLFLKFVQHKMLDFEIQSSA